MGANDRNPMAGVSQETNPTSLMNSEAAGQFYLDLGKPKDKTKKQNNQKKSDAGKEELPALNYNELQMFGNHVARKAGDNRRLLEVVGDFNSIVKTIVMGVISPNTLERGDMQYEITPESTIPEAMRNALLTTMVDYYDERYNVTSDMEHDLRDMLAGSGSVFKVVLPPDQIQAAVLNNTELSMESLNGNIKDFADDAAWGEKEFIPKQLGIFAGKEQRNDFSMEALWGDKPATEITANVPTTDANDLYGVDLKLIDNPTYLRNELISEQVAQRMYLDRIKATQGEFASAWSMEGINDHTYKEGETNEFQYQVRQIRLRDKDGKLLDKNEMGDLNELGRLDLDSLEITESDVEYQTLLPTALKVMPSESMVVVHRKGKPTQRIGYVLLMEKGGNPLTINYDEAVMRVRTNRINEPDASSNMIKRIRDDIYASKEDQEQNQNLSQHHVKILDHFKVRMNNFLTDSLRNGMFGEMAEFTSTDELALNAFFASMDEKGLRMLFIPASQVQHFAFEYDDFGLGKTMFDDARTLFNMKAALLHTQVYAAIVGARPIKDVVIKIDPDDQNPKRTAMKRVEELLRSEGMAMPWADISKSSLERNVLMSGMNITFEGNDNLPQARTDVKESRRETPTLNSDIVDLLDDLCYKSMGWTKEVVNWFQDAEIATTVISNNLQIARRIHLYQSVFLRHHKELAEKLIPHDGEFCLNVIRELEMSGKPGLKILRGLGSDTVEQVKKLKEMLPALVDDVVFKLPTPDSSVLKAKREEMENFITMLDTVMDGYISQEMFDATDEMRDQVEGYKGMVRSAVIRWYNQSNNVIPELNALFEKDGVSPIAGEHNEYIERLGKEVISVMTKLKSVDLELGDALVNEEDEHQRKKDEEEAKRLEEEQDELDNDPEPEPTTEPSDNDEGGQSEEDPFDVGDSDGGSGDEPTEPTGDEPAEDGGEEENPFLDN